jgi:hypothetical protein
MPHRRLPDKPNRLKCCVTHRSAHGEIEGDAIAGV